MKQKASMFFPIFISYLLGMSLVISTDAWKSVPYFSYILPFIAGGTLVLIGLVADRGLNQIIRYEVEKQTKNNVEKRDDRTYSRIARE